MDLTGKALERHHARMNRKARVSPGKTFNTFRTDYEFEGANVLVVIPTKNRLDLIKPCIDSILSTTGNGVHIVVIDHESNEEDIVEYLKSPPHRVQVTRYYGMFNFSRMNNTAVEEFGGQYEFILFLNNDIEAIESGWLEHMLGLCRRDDVGIVGALLLYEDNRVQHGGVVLGVGGPAEHVYKSEPYKFNHAFNPGYISGLVSVRDYMAVTGACMLIKKDVFSAIGGFDEALPVGFNDIDLCLRTREEGYKVLFDGHAVLHHYESATRAHSKQLVHPEDTKLMNAKWAHLLQDSDPYFSPMFGRDAPVSHAVAGPIDMSAKTRLWKRVLA